VGWRDDGDAPRAERGAGGYAGRRGGRWPWRALGRAHAVIGMAWATLGARWLTRVGFLSGNGGYGWMQGSKGGPGDMMAGSGGERRGGDGVHGDHGRHGHGMHAWLAPLGFLWWSDEEREQGDSVERFGAG
jgi:hypothetical protein